MARTASGLIRRGTAAEVAAVDAGYVASGASEYSRHTAGGSNRIDPADAPRKGRASQKYGPPEEFLAETFKRVRKLRRQLDQETNPLRRARLEKDFVIKSALLARLRAEAAQRNEVSEGA